MKRLGTVNKMTLLILTFKCPHDGTEINTSPQPFFKKVTTEVDAILYSLHCPNPHCKWQGQMPGSQRIKVRRVD